MEYTSFSWTILRLLDININIDNSNLRHGFAHHKHINTTSNLQ
jgi:hypothetical protein